MVQDALRGAHAHGHRETTYWRCAFTCLRSRLRRASERRISVTDTKGSCSPLQIWFSLMPMSGKSVFYSYTAETHLVMLQHSVRLEYIECGNLEMRRRPQ